MKKVLYTIIGIILSFLLLLIILPLYLFYVLGKVLVAIFNNKKSEAKVIEGEII